MKKLILATTALVALTAGSAGAADMAVKARPLPPPPPACAQFGGFYLGGNVGYGYYDYRYHDRGNLVQTIDSDLPTSASLNDNRWNAGVQVGYNWQVNCSVFGFEADWSWTGLKASGDFFDGDAGTQDSFTLESRVKWFGTARTRTGIVVDNVLLYVTGGLAFARFNRDLTVFEDAPATSATFSSSRTRWGWTAGFGTEWSFAPNWSLKSEVLYMRFQKDDPTFTGTTINGINFGVPGRSYVFNQQEDIWVTRIGVNYRFGGYAPVAARY
jgi:outer membrane immunogenic protein